MNHSVKKGFSFGLTSGIITTLGLVVGLNSSTHSKLVVLGGIIVIAIADSLSDALGIHISEEAEDHHTQKQIWQSTFATFITKLIIAMTFIVPVLLFSLYTAIIVSVIWGLGLIAVLSYYISRHQKISPIHIIAEHLAIAIFVIVVTHLVGRWVAGL